MNHQKNYHVEFIWAGAHGLPSAASASLLFDEHQLTWSTRKCYRGMLIEESGIFLWDRFANKIASRIPTINGQERGKTTSHTNPVSFFFLAGSAGSIPRCSLPPLPPPLLPPPSPTCFPKNKAIPSPGLRLRQLW